ncbi:ClcB-like voltage-gated chloride channel protein [Alcaligenes endophyticus]|uniref:ClcB-like voltage-gated chloride channel protein n=2 Tax=Alcaligenes endophyticus TaxID=1929088 RepID=A0ABT8EH35_9BURK|nr:ClcB-like voltage-gated chloride channel protein [Alcaligenes endophyticus]MCX5589740.1 ClcB-like voltage-gated chloride channel protein [Alcaligenes endophyticus]MDN4120596.1 ClcB-like voltage-gated chloride channel protein [Alcaligenes endophyticus]
MTLSVLSMRKRLQGLQWLSDTPAMLCWAVLVGVLGALSTIAFHEGMGIVQRLVAGQDGGIVHVTKSLPWYMRIAFPVLGGLVAGCLLSFAARYSTGAKSDYMEAVAIGDGRLSVREGLLRSLSSLFTVASGGSIGREGAMVHLSSLSASAIGRFTLFSQERLRLLVACGAAAGVASAYGAPIAAAVFVAEIVLGVMNIAVLGPLFIAAASANFTMRALGQYKAPYQMLLPEQSWGWSILLFALLGVVIGLAAPGFLKLMNWFRSLFKKTGLSLPIRLSLGGLMVGIVLVFVPDAAGNGYSVVSSMLHQHWTLWAVLGMLFFKLLATGLTVGSGAVGGVFTPAIFVGAAFGTLFGKVLYLILPDMQVPLYFFTLAGMGAFLGAAANAPFMAILMLFEMTLSYQLVLPLIVACVMAYFVAHAVAEVAMYEVTLVRERDAQLRHRLRHTSLNDLVRPADTTVTTDALVQDALQMFLEYPVKYLYVLDEQHQYQGVIAQQDITRLLLNDVDAQQRQVGDILRMDFVKPLHPGMSLDEAQEQFVHFSGERLPVISAEGGRLLGVVYKSAVLEKYSAIKRSLDTSGEVMLDLKARR